VKTLNLGILAHVDAGKTSLTERLLFAAGVIDEVGSVDDGNTQTDSLALERQRGITIKSAVVSFVIDDVTVNLIDTPGHHDFIAEVERVLSVLDGAVLVISAVEGVQAQTRVLMRTLQRLRIPTVIFVNKIDRVGAQDEAVLSSIAERLTPAIIAMGSARDLGSREASFAPFGATDAPFTAALADVLADHDDGLLADYVDDVVSFRRLRSELAVQARRASVHPVFFGSAMTGAGVDALIAGITSLLPAVDGDVDGPVSGTVFKVERGVAGEKVAFVRLFSGTVAVRERLQFGAAGADAKVTAISVFEHGSAAAADSVSAGRIGKLWGLADVRIGDALGVPAIQPVQHHFAPPSLETVVFARNRRDGGALHVALTQLTEQDPLINLRRDVLRAETLLSLYGEVQKEVIEATLADDFGIAVGFRETTTICIERVVGTGAAIERSGKAGNPFLATIGVRVEPAPVGSGVRYQIEIEPGSLPLSFQTAISETVTETLHQGLHGWQVPDCLVTLTHSGYSPRQSHAHAVFDKSMSSTGSDFRNLTPLVLMSALRQAGTEVHEPMHRFTIDAPADVLGAMMPVLVRLRAVPQTTVMKGVICILEGDIPAARVHELEQQLPGLTRGEGMLESALDHYEPVRGATPVRQRADHNPLNRKEYLLHVLRRV
jgi:ribosomal protection tetracycline resistance protein